MTSALAIISNVGLLVLYLLSCGAALELARRDIRMEAPPFSLRGTWLWPVLGGVIVLWILSTATVQELGVTAIVLAVATGLYAARQFHRRSTA